MTIKSVSSKPTILFIILAGFFITNALVAEFIGIKIFSLETSLGFDPLNLTIFGEPGLGFNLTTGVLLWPVIFVMTDIINEYYGAAKVKFLSYLTIGLIIYSFVMIYWAIHLSPNDWWANESGKLSLDQNSHINNMNLAFSKIMGQGLWIIIGSLVAFLIGQILDVSVFHIIKRKTGDQKVWLRATGSTLISQLVDSFVVLFIAFYIGSDWPLIKVLAIGVVNYSYKFVVAILLTPVIYFAHYIIDKYLGDDIAKRMKHDAALG